MWTHTGISKLNNAMSLKNAIALFSSEMYGGVTNSASHPQTMMYW